MGVMQAAITWSRRMEWPVFPTRRKVPVVPKGKSWKAVASKDPGAIRAMQWEEADGYGVALPSDWLVIDLDAVPGANGPDISHAMATVRKEMPGAAACIHDGSALLVKTPRGGMHAYFRHDNSFDLRQTSLPNVDLRVGGKGYVIGPDSPGYQVLVWGAADVRHAVNDLDAPIAPAVAPFLTARR
jgi:hypothetical protein